MWSVELWGKVAKAFSLSSESFDIEQDHHVTLSNLEKKQISSLNSSVKYNFSSKNW